MKMSIILGVIHMDFGIMNSLYNNMYFRDTLSTLWEFIPQMIFLNFIFGYLCILIIAKWTSGSLADLYHVMINMFLAPGSMDAQGQVFNGQGGLQVRAAAKQCPGMLTEHKRPCRCHCHRLRFEPSPPLLTVFAGLPPCDLIHLCPPDALPQALHPEEAL
jgi:vacuolar-type H+-ATPase subunit I/STV1